MYLIHYKNSASSLRFGGYRQSMFFCSGMSDDAYRTWHRWLWWGSCAWGNGFELFLFCGSILRAFALQRLRDIRPRDVIVHFFAFIFRVVPPCVILVLLRTFAKKACAFEYFREFPAAEILSSRHCPNLLSVPLSVKLNVYPALAASISLYIPRPVIWVITGLLLLETWFYVAYSARVA